MREVTPREMRDRMAALPLAQRRALVRSINRGQPAPERSQTALAIALAQRQQRFWRLAWLLGPALGVLQLFFAPWQRVLPSAISGSAMLGAMSLWWWARARRAEQANRTVLEARGGGQVTRRESTGKAEAAGPSVPGHLPARPPRPRGRKRG
jgi:hypothetical protein